MRKIDLYSFKKKEFVINFLLYFVFFLFLIHAYRDFDWGWHYRYGEYFIKNGKLLLEDPFTWDMAGYIWQNHSWAYDPLLYILYQLGGLTGLTVLGALVSFFIFIFGTVDRKISYWKMGVLMLFFANLSSGVIWQGLRSQMVGVLFLSVFLFLLRLLDKTRNRYIYMFLPFLFLLWVNFHGYFLVGLVCFGISIFSDFLLQIKEMKKNEKGLFIPKDILIKSGVFLLCILATMINPFSYHVYEEAYKHSTSPLLRLITEWLPVPFFTQFYALFLLYSLCLLGGFLWKRDIKILKWFLISAFTFILASTARRYNFVFAAASLPLAMYVLQSTPLKLERFKTTYALFLVVLIVSLEIAFFRRLPGFEFYSYTFDSYCRLGSSCSENLTKYLLENPPKGRGFNFYDWGGYLIGRGLGKNLFVDGRMHLWEREGYQPFLEYQKMFYEGDMKKFNSYDFQWFIVPTNSIFNKNAIESKSLEGWEIVFQDKGATYAVRKL